MSCQFPCPPVLVCVPVVGLLAYAVAMMSWRGLESWYASPCDQKTVVRLRVDTL